MKEPLYVVTSIFNPHQYESRYDLYKKFVKYISDSGAILYTVELAFNDADFFITDSSNPNHIQLRTNSCLWYKENLLNIAISRLPSNAKNIAWIDADITFLRPDWAEETVKLLKKHKIIQLFTHALDLNKKFETFQTHIGFAYAYSNNLFIDDTLTVAHEGIKGNGHPGYAWAATRQTLDELGGLIDYSIIGSADNHMALALVGNIDKALYKNMSDNYKLLLFEWQKRCKKYVPNIGYLNTTLVHYWHGSKKNRGYVDRWKILSNNNFDPIIDLKKDSSGLYILNKKEMESEIFKYFESRKEDE